MLIATGDPAGDPALAAELIEVQRAAYAVEARLIGSDAIPALHETVDDLRAAGLQWLVVRSARGGRSAGGSPHQHESPGRVLGAIGFTQAGGTVDIDRLVVHPDAFRGGIGRALVAAAIVGASVVTVSTGRDNPPARRLYESLGFQHTGDVEVVPGLWVSRYRADGR